MRKLLLWLSFGLAAWPAHALYLNGANMTVTVPAATFNPFMGMSFEEGLRRIIDAPSADAAEYHDVSTHVFVFGDRITLRFDFGREVDLQAVHFWNYHTDYASVDTVLAALRNDAGEELRLVNFDPRPGGLQHSDATPIYAESFPMLQSHVRTVTLLMRSDDYDLALDFQNIGFTAADPVPEPGAAWLFGAGLLGLMGLRRRRR